MHILQVIDQDIIKITEKFDPNKSAGHDNVENFVV